MNSTATAEMRSGMICLDPGLAIGYRDRLAEVGRRIELSSGTHYLLGRNGRGKTTLFRTLCGIIKPLSGGFTLEGRSRFFAEDLQFDRELSGSAVLDCLLEKKAASEAKEFGESIELDLKKPYGKLSTGNKRKLSLLVAEFGSSSSEKDILMLDEPFTGLDAPSRQAFLNRWEQESGDVVRLVSAHPDFDDMRVPSALVISDGNLEHHQSDSACWGELRQYLN